MVSKRSSKTDATERLRNLWNYWHSKQFIEGLRAALLKVQWITVQSDGYLKCKRDREENSSSIRHKDCKDILTNSAPFHWETRTGGFYVLVKGAWRQNENSVLGATFKLLKGCWITD